MISRLQSTPRTWVCVGYMCVCVCVCVCLCVCVLCVEGREGDRVRVADMQPHKSIPSGLFARSKVPAAAPRVSALAAAGSNTLIATHGRCALGAVALLPALALERLLDGGHARRAVDERAADEVEDVGEERAFDRAVQRAARRQIRTGVDFHQPERRISCSGTRATHQSQPHERRIGSPGPKQKQNRHPPTTP